MKLMPKKLIINPEESALVVKDMQKDFCYEDGALFMGEGVEEIIPKIRGLIEKAIRKKTHLIFAQDWHSPESEEFVVWGQHCIRDTRGAEIIDELSPFSKEEFVVKKRDIVTSLELFSMHI